MTAPAGLRERKKAATKSALAKAATRLAVERGAIDGVSPDDIAAEAGVSTRTFHNYFRNREEAFLHDFESVTGEFLEGIRDRAQRMPIWDALREASIALRLDERFDLRLLQCKDELVRTSPELVQRQAGQFVQVFGEVLGIVAEATGFPADDLYPKLLLGSALVAMKTGHDHWIAHPEEDSLEHVLRRSFDSFEAGITRPITE